MRLQDILAKIDSDEVLVDQNGEEWTPDNIENEDGDFHLSAIGIHLVGSDGFMAGLPVYRFKNQ